MYPAGIGKTLHPFSSPDEAKLEPSPNVSKKRRNVSIGAERLWQASMSQIIKQSNKDRTIERKLSGKNTRKSSKEGFPRAGMTENTSQVTSAIVSEKATLFQSGMKLKTVWLKFDISNDSEQSTDGTASIAVISEEPTYFHMKEDEATSDILRCGKCFERETEKSDGESASYVLLKELPCQCSKNTLTSREKPTCYVTDTSGADDESSCSTPCNGSMNCCNSSYIAKNQKSHRKLSPAFVEEKRGLLASSESRGSLKVSCVSARNTLFMQRKSSAKSSSEPDDVNSPINFCRLSKSKPMFHQYQLIGDSQLLRFAEQVLHERCSNLNGIRQLGMCVNGQTIRDLLKLVKSSNYPMLKNVIVMIGTNDFLRCTPMFAMKKHLADLLSLLKKRYANTIKILTIPPIPKLEGNCDFWKRWKTFNDFIRSFTKIDLIQIVDISSHYLTSENKCKRSLFEEFYGISKRRDDIHFNKLGLFTLRDILMEELSLNKQ